MLASGAAGVVIASLLLYGLMTERRLRWRSVKKSMQRRLRRCLKWLYRLATGHDGRRRRDGDSDDSDASDDSYSSSESDDDFEFPPALAALYDNHGLLGRGKTARVYAATERATGAALAIKVVDLYELPEKWMQYVNRECDILRKLQHPNVIKLHRTHEVEGDMLFIVLERCLGGELFERIVKRTRFSEVQAREILVNIVNAVDYIHSRGFVHRDLKPENIMLASEESDTDIRIIDFGLSKYLGKPKKKKRRNLQRTKSKVGTPHYVAPEVMQGASYSYACDFYSVGAILWVLLTGENPVGDFEDYEDSWSEVSPEARDLTAKLMERNPRLRLDGPGVLEHPWVKSRSLPTAPLLKAQTSLTHYVKKAKMANAMHMAMFIQRIKKRAARRIGGAGGAAAAAHPLSPSSTGSAGERRRSSFDAAFDVVLPSSFVTSTASPRPGSDVADATGDSDDGEDDISSAPLSPRTRRSYSEPPLYASDGASHTSAGSGESGKEVE